jgi:tetratricopeptide (TPR) repeat protein
MSLRWLEKAFHHGKVINNTEVPIRKKELSDRDKMSKRRGSKKGRKLRLRFAKVFFFGIILISLLYLMINFTLIKHIKELRTAIDRYDNKIVTEELTWIDENASWLNKIPFIRDAGFWSRLNQGEYENIDSQLTQFSDDKHRFWLFQVHLAKDEESRAQQDLAGFNSAAYRALANGLLNIKQGKYEEGYQQIQSSAESELSRDEQVLKNISLARIEILRGNQEKAQAAWQKAKEVSPLNPLIREMEYDLALASGQWGKAKEVFLKLEENPSYSERPDFLTKKALLALTVGERPIWEQAIEKLSKMTNGKAYIDYLLGIENYEQGQFKEAMKYFQSALAGNLPEQIQQDAEKSWIQSKERVEAELALSKVKKL